MTWRVLADVEPSRRRHDARAGLTTWGPWTYDPRARVLIYGAPGHPGYEIDMDRCRTSEAMCDWLAQIIEKRWATPDVVGHLARAMHDVVGLR